MINRDQVLDMTFQRVISVPETCHFSHVCVELFHRFEGGISDANSSFN